MADSKQNNVTDTPVSGSTRQQGISGLTTALALVLLQHLEMTQRTFSSITQVFL